MHLDVLCQNTIKYGKLAFARVHNGEIKCIDAEKMDPHMTGTCLDVCFNEFSCVGAPAYQDALDEFPVLRIDKDELFQSMCSKITQHLSNIYHPNNPALALLFSLWVYAVTSPLQKKLDETFCTPGQYLRFNKAKQMWNCHTWSKETSQNGMLDCLDDCGQLVPCINPGPVQLPVNAPLVESFASENRSKQCSKSCVALIWPYMRHLHTYR